MTITLPLDPHQEARLIALARSRGLSPEALIRDAVVKILANSSGAALVSAMQASPHREIEIEPARYPLPVRDVDL